MFSKDMADALDSTMNGLNICMSQQNVINNVTSHLEELRLLLDKVDPDKVNFEGKNIITDMFKKRYWSKFENAYEQLQSLVDDLGVFDKVLYNTNNTLRILQDSYETERNKFIAEYSQDSENIEDYTKQLLVVDNMHMLLSDTILQYTTLSNTVTSVLDMLIKLVDMGVLIMRIKYNRSDIAKARKIITTGSVTERDFVNTYQTLKSLIP